MIISNGPLELVRFGVQPLIRRAEIVSGTFRRGWNSEHASRLSRGIALGALMPVVSRVRTSLISTLAAQNHAGICRLHMPFAPIGEFGLRAFTGFEAREARTGYVRFLILERSTISPLELIANPASLGIREHGLVHQ